MDIRESLPTINDIMSVLEAWAAPHLAASYDNVGLHIGDATAPVHAGLVALDLTPAVIAEAIRHKVSLIITHHPLFFHPLRSLTAGDLTGSMALRLAEARIALYTAHTNLDSVRGGVSFALATLLGVERPRFLSPDDNTASGLGAIGQHKHPQNLRTFLYIVATRLQTSSLRFVGTPDHSVKTVAVFGGSVASLLRRAPAQRAERYFTSDIAYHRFFEVLRPDGSYAMALLDAGHYETERHTEAIIIDVLQDQFPQVMWRQTAVRTSPVQTFHHRR